MLTYTGQSRNIWAVAWSPNGTRIASASDDGTTDVWDASTSSNVFQYDGQGNAIYALAWSPDGTRIASGSGDDTVQIWQPA